MKQSELLALIQRAKNGDRLKLTYKRHQYGAALSDMLKARDAAFDQGIKASVDWTYPSLLIDGGELRFEASVLV